MKQEEKVAVYALVMNGEFLFDSETDR